ncbi:hypothetical protein VTO42DRAFT_2761 [Malbranchea cinnamomea]
MPPRVLWRLAPQFISCTPRTLSPPSLLFPLLPSQILTPARGASILASLSDNQGAYSKRIRRGRGPASGKGKTSGRGHKGQKQHGSVPAGFNGGQTKDSVVQGERGFKNIFSVKMSKVNLDRLQDWIDQGRINPTKPITLRELVKSRCIHGIKDGVKLLGRGGTNALKQPINIVVSRASASAIQAVEAAGGTVVTRYYTRHAIKRILAGKTDPFVSLAWTEDQSLKIGMGIDKPRVKGEGFQYRLPDPTSRKDIEYYRDPAHRGYLSYLVAEGEGPSLFFLPPDAKAKRGKKTGNKASENRVW